MMKLPVKVLVVDDSAFMRLVITRMLEDHQHITVVGSAKNGIEALDMIDELRPNVVTLDVEMPEMDGLQTLGVIMQKHPLPVVMLSALTTAGADATIKALELGAVDFVAKPKDRRDLGTLAKELPDKVILAAQVSPGKMRRGFAIPQRDPGMAYPHRVSDEDNHIQVVCIGTSTGGPAALHHILSSLPGNLPAGVIIVQHMPKGFTGPLAMRLNQVSPLLVEEAKENDLVLPGKALVAPAGMQLTLEEKAGGIVTRLGLEAPVKTLFKPSVDVTFLSVAKVYGSRSLAVILTGMGRDGVIGLKAIKEKKGLILAQDEDTCVVYGMPRAAVEAGLVDKIVSLDAMSREIINLVRSRSIGRA